MLRKVPPSTNPGAHPWGTTFADSSFEDSLDAVKRQARDYHHGWGSRWPQVLPLAIMDLGVLYAATFSIPFWKIASQ